MSGKWISIEGYKERYEINDMGQVRSLDRYSQLPGKFRKRIYGKLLKPVLCKNGYQMVSLFSGEGGMDRRYVHHLVLEAFCGERPEGMESRHLNGKKVDNRAANLRWGTRSENMADRVLHGVSNRGERQGRSKLSEIDVHFIRHWLKQGFSRFSVAACFGVHRRTIDDIAVGNTWGWLKRGET